jgi:asparagine synthase (glutamine-hydrolysing)
MAEEMSEPVRTFSIGFEETDFSELDYARVVARQLGTQHHEEIVRPDAVSILPELVRHYGEPFGDSSAIPTYYVARLARCHVPMVLTGDGGDEALLGYDRYAGWLRWIHPGLPKRASWKRAIRPALQKLSPARFPEDLSLREPKLKDWLGWVPGTGEAVRSALWRPELAASMSQPMHELDEVEIDAKSVQPEQFGQYVDYRTYLPHDILTKVDIASMRHGLETRTPLVDVRIAEFAATIPWDVNLRRNAGGTWTGKALLKALVAQKFGSDFVQRKKAGFSVPLNHWFAEGGMLRPELEDRLLAPDASINRYFQPKAMRRLIGEHGTAAQDHSTVLWQLLFFESWLEHVGSSVRSKPDSYRAAALDGRSSALA